MPTTFNHRILLVVPAAKVPVVVAWMQANFGANSVPADLGPGLSPSGNAPATYNWCCGCFTDAEAKAILSRLCTLASIATPTPAQWNNATQSQKIAWLHSVQAAILSGYGAWVGLADNVGQWDDPESALAAVGLKRIVTVPP